MGPFQTLVGNLATHLTVARASESTAVRDRELIAAAHLLWQAGHERGWSINAVTRSVMFQMPTEADAQWSRELLDRAFGLWMLDRDRFVVEWLGSLQHQEAR